MTFQLYEILDQTYSRDGVLKVIRSGNGYAWHIFGQHNLEGDPLFSGREGTFFDALHEGENRLHKDLSRIFWILNEASVKERKEGEPKDAELIEHTIRELNAGSAKRAVHYLDAVIEREVAEREPEDVARLQMARSLIMAEKSVRYDPCPECTNGPSMSRGGKPRDRGCRNCGGSGLMPPRSIPSPAKPWADHKSPTPNTPTAPKDTAPAAKPQPPKKPSNDAAQAKSVLSALGVLKGPHRHPETGGTVQCSQCKRQFKNGFGHQVHDGKVHDMLCEDKVKRPNDHGDAVTPEHKE